MDNVLQLALAKAFDEPKNRPTPGEYRVDTLVRIVGTVKVGEDYEQTVTASIPWQRLFEVALSKLNGVTIESIVRDALDSKESPEIKEAVQNAVSKLKAGAIRECKGKVTTNIVAIKQTKNQKFLQA